MIVQNVLNWTKNKFKLVSKDGIGRAFAKGLCEGAIEGAIDGLVVIGLCVVAGCVVASVKTKLIKGEEA